MKTNNNKVVKSLLVFWLVAIACFLFLSSVKSSAIHGQTTCETLHQQHMENPGDKETIFQAWEINCPFQDKNGNHLYQWEPNT